MEEPVGFAAGLCSGPLAGSAHLAANLRSGKFCFVLRRAAKQTLRWVDQNFGSDLSIRAHQYRRGEHRNDYHFPTSQIAFMRIPKTGGTTLARVLSSAAGNAFVNLKTHLPISLHCPPQYYRYITVLRDPCERVWSHYQMVKRRGASDPYHIYADRGLEHFLKHCWESRNMMTGYLIGRPHRRLPKSCIRHAQRNLDAFFFVGDFNDLESDIRALLTALGCAVDEIDIPHENRGTKEALPAQHRELIARHNDLDLDLYDYFVQRRQRNGGCWERAIEDSISLARFEPAATRAASARDGAL